MVVVDQRPQRFRVELRIPRLRTGSYFPSFLEPRRWGELLSRFGIVLGRILGTQAPGFWISSLAVGLFLLLTRRGLLDPLLAVLALQMLAYLAAFAISSADPIWKVDSCFQRIAATLLPALFLVLGARLSAPGNDGSGTTRGSGRETAKEVAHAPLEIRPAGDLAPVRPLGRAARGPPSGRPRVQRESPAGGGSAAPIL